MRVLVTGAGGFAGRHVTRELVAAGHQVLALSHEDRQLDDTDDLIVCDVTDTDGVSNAFRQTAPDACIHLAGIAFVPAGWQDPAHMMNVNLNGAINILEAMKTHASEAACLLVTSAELYGRTHDEPVTEETEPAPSNPYALSKLSADLMGLLYAKRYGLHIMTARVENHIGPGQSTDFVVPSFAAQLLELADAQSPVMKVGNLQCKRSFLDVRDVARAYRMLIEKGKPGEAYNISSGKIISIRSILDKLMDITGAHPQVQVDPDRFRPTDQTPIFDNTKIRNHVGWSPEISMEQTLRDVVDSMRN